MTRISISVPEEVSRQLRLIQRRERIKLSHVVVEALKDYFARHQVSAIQSHPQESPTVLWKLKASGGLALRSPRLSERRIREGWVVEEY
jgi:hypothetical protein